MRVRRTLLMPLTPIYAAIVTWKRRLYATGRLKSRTLENAVISVGSLSAGGAGKTPMVLLLAEVLGRREYAVRILTRGYGRGSTEVERVKLDTERNEDARRYGDEPVLLARRSGAPVYVGADRYRAGLMAGDMPEGRTVVHLLDDGFQHRRLARDLDIVLLTRKDVEDVLLPGGDLREPLSTLREADVIVLREEEEESLCPVVSSLMRGRATPAIWVIRRRLEFGAGGEAGFPRRVVAFCGIARPEGFFAMLEAEGLRAATTRTFGDHHRYGERDVERLLDDARASGADGFVTTEKDAVKLTAEMRRRLEGVGRVVVAELRVELVDERGALEQMISMTPKMDRRRSRP